MKKLFKLTTKGVGDFYVIAVDSTTAENKLLEILNTEKYGYSLDRYVTNISIITEEIENQKMQLSSQTKRLIIS